MPSREVHVKPFFTHVAQIDPGYPVIQPHVIRGFSDSFNPNACRGFIPKFKAGLEDEEGRLESITKLLDHSRYYVNAAGIVHTKHRVRRDTTVEATSGKVKNCDKNI